MVNLESLIHLRDKERRFRGVLHLISKTQACVAYGFEKDGLSGYRTKEPTGVAFLIKGKRRSVWKYVSFDLLSMIASDSIAEEIENRQVIVSRGSARREMSLYTWHWIESAQKNVDRLGEKFKSNEPFIYRLEQAMIGTICESMDPQLYEKGKEKHRYTERYWRISAKTPIAHTLNTLEKIAKDEGDRLASNEAHQFHSDSGRQLPAEISTDPYYKRVGD